MQSVTSCGHIQRSAPNYCPRATFPTCKWPRKLHDITTNGGTAADTLQICLAPQFRLLRALLHWLTCSTLLLTNVHIKLRGRQRPRLMRLPCLKEVSSTLS